MRNRRNGRMIEELRRYHVNQVGATEETNVSTEHIGHNRSVHHLLLHWIIDSGKFYT